MATEFKVGDIVTPVSVWQTMGASNLYPVGDTCYHGELGKIVSIGKNIWDGGTYYVIESYGCKFYARAHAIMFPESN